MDLEFGLKFSKAVYDDFISTDLHINKDRGSLLFVSTETNSMFILTANLRGYKRENIRMSISPDGTQFKIEGQYPIQETVFIGGEVLKSIKTMEFKKSFGIPDGVILNDINATFDEEESVLTIAMPKTVHGIRGVAIKEVIEEFDDVKKEVENEKLANDYNVNDPSPIADRDRVYDKIEEQNESQSRMRSVEENDHVEPRVNKEDHVEQRVNKEDHVEPKVNKEDEKSEGKIEGPPNSLENRKPNKSSNICNSSIIVGSALFASLIAIVIHFIKSKSNTKKKNY